MVPAFLRSYSMFISNKMAMFLSAATLPILVATAQEAPKGPGGPKEGFGGFPPYGMRGGERRIMQDGPQSSGLIFARMLSRPEFIKGLGLPEDVVAKLTEGLKGIDDQERALREELNKLRGSQAEALAALMSDRTKTGDAIRETAAKIEALQVKLFGLGVDRMLLVRDNLTDEQIKQASEQVKKTFESRRDEMMRRRGGGQGGPEGRRPARGDLGKGRKPEDGPKDGPKDAPPPPPPSPAE